jgi:hypothetical protein
LLDDMAVASMNSIVICVSCKYKAYRSRLPYLQNDQDPSNVVIVSDNEIVRLAIRAAHRRGIKVWVQTIANCYARDGFDLPLPRDAVIPKYQAFKYDLDSPCIQDRAVEQCEELSDLFPEMDGFCVEFEGHNVMYRHRVGPYNAWAGERGRPLFEEVIARPPNPRACGWPEFRAYTTWQTCGLLRRIEAALRARGFGGDLGTIVGSSGVAGAYALEADLSLFKEMVPNWVAVTYEYDRWENRLATADYTMAYPVRMGLRTHFLGRGVMTWGLWDLPDLMPVSFEDHWRADFEDALRLGVDGLWMFEADAFTDGPHVAKSILQAKGFPDGVEARRRLLAVAAEVGVARALADGTGERP